MVCAWKQQVCVHPYPLVSFTFPVRDFVRGAVSSRKVDGAGACHGPTPELSWGRRWKWSAPRHRRRHALDRSTVNGDVSANLTFSRDPPATGEPSSGPGRYTCGTPKSPNWELATTELSLRLPCSSHADRPLTTASKPFEAGSASWTGSMDVPQVRLGPGLMAPMGAHERS
jgi:hypothetical protein